MISGDLTATAHLTLAVTVVSRTTYDDLQPVQLARYVYRADRLRLRHEMGGIPVT